MTINIEVHINILIIILKIGGHINRVVPQTM